MIAPGNSQASRLYLKLIGSQYGPKRRSQAKRVGLNSVGSLLGCDGQALVALREAGALAASDAAYKRGIAFLLKSQLEDGSWYVKSRAIPFQPYFESGFPHGHDQWVSMAASNLATMALALDARR